VYGTAGTNGEGEYGIVGMPGWVGMGVGNVDVGSELGGMPIDEPETPYETAGATGDP
jgi:hypothetical protein